MILYLAVFNLLISFGVLFLIKKGKIKKYCNILRYVNITQIIAILLIPIILIFLMIDLEAKQPIINDGRGFGILTFFIYALLGIVIFIINVVIVLFNWRIYKTSRK